MRDLILDFRRGGGSVPEVVHGIVRIWGTEVRPNATSLVLTTETTLKLTEGKATLANAQTSGTGPLYEWAYIIQVEPFCGRNYRFYVAIPDGTGPINLVDLPKLNPITGEGFYLDIEEWEALYGDLPDRVDALETSQATQDGKITSLEARPSGNATMRVDTTVGTRIFITDGVTEHMVSGDTGWRNLGAIPGTAVTAGNIKIRRVNDMVELLIDGLMWNNAAPGRNVLPTGGMDIGAPGFGPASSNSRPLLAISDSDIAFFDNLIPYMAGSGQRVLYLRWVSRMGVDGFRTEPVTSAKPLSGSLVWTTSAGWPTSYPGTPE